MSTCAALESEQTTGRDASDIIARLLPKLQAKLGGLDPNDTLIVQCRLFDWSRQTDFMPVIAEDLLTWMRKTWRHISEHQTFLLLNPRTMVGEILGALSGEGTSTKIIAKALLVAEKAVRASLHDDMRAWLVSLAT